MHTMQNNPNYDHGTSQEIASTLADAHEHGVDAALFLLDDAYAADVSEHTRSLVYTCFVAASLNGWWTDPATGLPKERNVGETLMLMVSEIGEAMEAHRKSLMDDHLPDRLGIEVELADALIRICDFAGRYGLDLGGAVRDKLAYNAVRLDHKKEARMSPDGKQY